MTQHQTCIVLRPKYRNGYRCNDCRRPLGFHVYVRGAGDKLIRCCSKCTLLFHRARIVTKGMIEEIANHIVADGYGSLETPLRSKVEEVIQTIERVLDERDERRPTKGGKS